MVFDGLITWIPMKLFKRENNENQCNDPMKRKKVNKNNQKKQVDKWKSYRKKNPKIPLHAEILSKDYLFNLHSGTNGIFSAATIDLSLNLSDVYLHKTETQIKMKGIYCMER